jgi:anti-sigma regulatory factor (Ser/Thr protein kinase)
MFTDGLIERRTQDLDLGRARIVAQLRDCDPVSAPAALRALLAGLAGDHEDDVAILCAGFTDPPGPARPRMARAWIATRLRLDDARSVAAEWLRDVDREDLTDDIVLTVSELLTNARDASEGDDPIRLRLHLDDLGGVVASVENVGEGFEPDPTMPGIESPRGRGLAIVQRLCESLTVDVVGQTVRVEARFPAPTH